MDVSAKPTQVTSAATGQRSLHAAVTACFSDDPNAPPFQKRIVELTAALTNAASVSLWSFTDTETSLLAFAGHKLEPDVATDLVAHQKGRDAPSFKDRYLVTRLSTPSAQDAIMVVQLAANGAAVQAMAYERVSLLAAIARAQFQHPKLQGQVHLATAVRALQNQGQDALQSLVDSLAELSGADFAAAGYWTGRQIENLCISGQAGFARRAQIPSETRKTLTDTARARVMHDNRIWVPNFGSGPDLCVMLRNPAEANDLLAYVAGLFVVHAPARQTRRNVWQPLSRWAVGLAILGGISLVPIPDRVRIPVTVEASQTRILSAPDTTVLSDVLVEDGASVAVGTPVARLDIQDAELELIQLRAERASAVIEQETARFSGNAAALRNAELTVQRIDAQIAREMLRVDSALITAPIDGVVVLGDLRQRIGSTVRQGDPLIEIAKTGAVELSLAVLARDIGRIKVDDTGVFRPDFDPTIRAEARVTEIAPAIDLSAEVPVAPGTAEVLGTNQVFTPGSTGVLRLGNDRRPIWKIVSSQVRDWILVRVWP